MAYPNLEQYREVLQFHHISLLDQELSKGEIQKNHWGVPHALTGGFALTFSIQTKANKYAVRCFHKESKDLEKRYFAISKKLRELKSSYFLDFEFQSRGIKIGTDYFPIVKMEWGRGETLGNFLSARFHDKRSLANLQRSLKSLAAFLEETGIAHGDIHPENVLVSDEGRTMRLIDYDGMFVDELLPIGGSETGHRNFQHPERSIKTWNKSIDRFSFILLYFALDLLQDDPNLWVETQSNNESIIFTANDFSEPTKSKLVEKLVVNKKYLLPMRRFANISKSPFEVIPSLNDFIAGENIPVFIPPRLIQKRMGKKNVQATQGYKTDYPVLEGNDFLLCRRHIGDKVEVVGKIVSFFDSKTKDGRRYVFLNFGDWRGEVCKITIWSNILPYLLLKPDRSWEGKWVSVIGLMEPYNYEDRTHVQIELKDVSSMKLLNEKEAMFRLGRAKDCEPGNAQKKEVEYIFLEKGSNEKMVHELSKNIPLDVNKTTISEGRPGSIQEANQKVLNQIKNLQPSVKSVSPTPTPVKAQIQGWGRSNPPVSVQTQAKKVSPIQPPKTGTPTKLSQKSDWGGIRKKILKFLQGVFSVLFYVALFYFLFLR